jgi:hypothetical protein
MEAEDERAYPSNWVGRLDVSSAIEQREIAGGTMDERAPGPRAMDGESFGAGRLPDFDIEWLDPKEAGLGWREQPVGRWLDRRGRRGRERDELSSSWLARRQSDR